jgi:hypothetical protein
MLWYCHFKWHSHTTREQVAKRILELHHARDGHRPESLKGWYNLAEGMTSDDLRRGRRVSYFLGRHPVSHKPQRRISEGIKWGGIHKELSGEIVFETACKPPSESFLRVLDIKLLVHKSDEHLITLRRE